MDIGWDHATDFGLNGRYNMYGIYQQMVIYLLCKMQDIAMHIRIFFFF